MKQAESYAYESSRNKTTNVTQEIKFSFLSLSYVGMVIKACCYTLKFNVYELNANLYFLVFYDLMCKLLRYFEIGKSSTKDNLFVLLFSNIYSNVFIRVSCVHSFVSNFEYVN